jgi:hypothetical protein
MGKAQDFLTEKQAGGGAVAIEEVQDELARGDWGRIATQTVDELTSYWFDDGSRLVSGRFDDDEFIIRADPAYSEEDFQNMTPDEVEDHLALIASLKE